MKKQTQKQKKVSREELIDELRYLLNSEKKDIDKMLRDVSVTNLLKLKELIEQYGYDRYNDGWDSGYDNGRDSGYDDDY